MDKTMLRHQALVTAQEIARAAGTSGDVDKLMADADRFLAWLLKDAEGAASDQWHESEGKG